MTVLHLNYIQIDDDYIVIRDAYNYSQDELKHLAELELQSLGSFLGIELDFSSIEENLDTYEGIREFKVRYKMKNNAN